MQRPSYLKTRSCQASLCPGSRAARRRACPERRSLRSLVRPAPSVAGGSLQGGHDNRCGCRRRDRVGGQGDSPTVAHGRRRQLVSSCGSTQLSRHLLTHKPLDPRAPLVHGRHQHAVWHGVQPTGLVWHGRKPGAGVAAALRGGPISGCNCYMDTQMCRLAPLRADSCAPTLSPPPQHGRGISPAHRRTQTSRTPLAAGQGGAASMQALGGERGRQVGGGG